MAEATGTAEQQRESAGGKPGVLDRLPGPSLSFEMVLLLPSIVFLAVISIIPLVALLWMSVMEVGLVGRPSEFVGLENYADVLTDDRHINSWKTTLIYVGSALTLQTVLGVLVAVSLDAVDRAENAFTTVIIMPMMIAPVVVGLLWQFLFSNTFGLYAFVLQQFGLFTETPILADDTWALPAIIIMDTWQWTPLVILIVLARLKSLPNQVYEAAAIDGANPWQRFRYVTYPLIKPAIAIALLLRSMDLLRFFDKIFITTGGGPADATKVIGMFIYEEGLRYQNYGPAAALGIVLMIVTIIIGFVFVEFFMGGGGDDE